MKIVSEYKRLMCALFAAAFALTFSAAAHAAPPNHLVITQVYGGGGGSNSAIVYQRDYVEIFNPTSAPINLGGLSVQYGAAGGNFGTSASNVAVLPNQMLNPGQFFLIAGSGGPTNAGAPLPVTPDLDAAVSLAATGGKVALVNGITGNLSGTTCSGANIVDEVSFAAGPSCAESSPAQAAPASSNALAVFRTDVCVDTDSNAADFSTGAPAPRNTATPVHSCAAAPVATLSVASALASPASVNSGSSTTLNVVVTPGSGTTSATVTADLSAIGGSNVQPLTPGATAFTYSDTYTVPSGTAANSYSIPVTVTDQTTATASGSIPLTVTTPVATTPIATVQAARSTYVGTTITFNGIITMVTNAGYYVQTPSSTPGSTGDEGIYVYTGGHNPATALVGNNVTVTGKLTLFPAATVSHTPSLEVENASLTVNGTGNPLPTPIPVAPPTANGGIYQLSKYESMRVSFTSLTVTGPTGSTLVEPTETSTSNGQFYAVAGTTPRPFRDPGMDFRDFPAATCPTVDNCTATATVAGIARPSGVTLFDDNPERIIVESSLGGGAALDLSTGATLTGPTGVLDFSYATDVPFGDPARLILDAGVFTPTSANLTQGMTVQPVGLPGAGQFTVAAFNVERFFNDTGSDNFYYDPVAGTSKPISSGNSVVVTTAAYQRRLKKISLAIRTVLNSPDVVSIEEVENVSVLKDMAAQIGTDSGGAVTYTAYGTDSTSTFTNDVGGISVGFLVKSTVGVTKWEQIGNTSTFTASSGQQTLNDRPSQVLHATISRGAGVAPYAITVISNHLRSLSGESSGATSADTRLKKELQAEMLATAIQGYQANGEHVLAVGDFNAFQFSDGYNDVLGTVTGNPGTNVAAQPGKGGILSKPVIDLITTLPANLQQTYVEFGNAQVLDHVVVTQDLASTGLQVAHFDSDFPEVLGNDATTAARVSDHDAPVAYLALPAPVTSATLTGSGTFATPVNVGGTSASGQQLTLTNTGETTIGITGFTVTGAFAQSNTCGTSLAPGATCAVNVVFKPTVAGSAVGSITLNGSATVAAVALSGTGIAPGDFTLSDANGTTTTAATVTAGGTANLALKLASVNGFAGSVALTCAAAGAAPLGVACTVVSPVTLTAAGTATSNVILTTTASTLSAGVGVLPASHAGRMATLLLSFLLAAAVFLLRRNGRRVRAGGLLVLLAALAMVLTGCGESKSTTTPNPSATPTGTYTYKVTATSGSIAHTQTISLTVQ